MKAIVLVAPGGNTSWLGPYGNEWVQTSALDRLAAEGIVFDSHVADRPDPATAWQSLWSGRYPFSTNAPAPADSPLAALPDQGVRTVWLRDLAAPLEPAWEEAWDTVISPQWDAPAARPLALIGAVEAALHDLAGDEHWLLWIETDRLLPPWSIDEDVFAAYAQSCGPLLEDDAAPEPEEPGQPVTPDERPTEGFVQGLAYPEWLRLRSSFAAVVSQFDAELEEIFERFRQAGLERDALWVVTSATGYPLGEHGLIGFAHPWLYGERTHLPLLLRLPGGDQAGRRVSELTQPVDVLPTLLDWFQLPTAADAHGRSLLPLARGGATPIRDYVVSALSGGNESELALQTRQWMLRLPSPAGGEGPHHSQLFQKPDDRWDVNDLRGRNLEWAEHLAERLRGFAVAAAQPGPLAAPAVKAYDDFIREPGPTTTPDQGGEVP